MEKWIPIVDYAVLKGISTSTLRRYIKAQKIQYKIEDGRYLIKWDENSPRMRPNWDGIRDVTKELARDLNEGRQQPVGISLQSQDKMQSLEKELARAKIENEELKMLVAIYEEKLATANH
jgi:hypothetical protein